MPLIADRVVETSTSTGIGSISLDGADLDHEAFRDAFATAAEVFYVISQTGTAWEVGIGTLTHGVPDTLSRDTVLSSSNADALVNFGAGTKNVFNVPPAGLFAPLVLDPTGAVRFDFDKSADVASAATTDIGAATGNSVTITGAVAITALGTIKAGVWRLVRFAGALTLTHSAASLILPGGASITTAAGDMMLALSDGSGNWRVPFYQRASGGAVVELASIAVAPSELSNNAVTPLTKIDIAAKTFRAEDAAANVVLPATTIDITVAGNGGRLDGDTLTANTWYHVLAGRNTSDGAFVAGFKKALAKPAAWDNFRRVRSIVTDASSNIIPDIQIGDRVLYKTPTLQVTAQAMSTASSTLRTLLCPLGVRTEVEYNWGTTVSAAGSGKVLYFHPPDVTSAVPSQTAAPLHSNDTIIGNAATTATTGGSGKTMTNTSSQIAERSSQAGNISIATIAYTDRRGRDD